MLLTPGAPTPNREAQQLGDSKPYSWTQEGRREYYEKNKERINAERRKQYAENSELRIRIKTYNKGWRSKNREYEQERGRRIRDECLVNRRKVSVGECQRCGYNRSMAALDWHHVDPSQKRFRDLRKQPDEVVEAELAKCVLICSNCHREHHAGIWRYEEIGTDGQHTGDPGASKSTDSATPSLF